MKDNINYYIAGLIDGEGTITMAVRNNNSQFRYPVVSMSSTTLPMLNLLKNRYGGTISKHKIYKDHHKQSWSWKVVYNNALLICQDIDGLLLEPEKQRRVSLLLNEYNSVTKRNGKYSSEELKLKKDFESKFFSESPII